MLEQIFDKQELRVVGVEESLQVALRRMQESRRSGIVTKLAGRPTVLTAAMLVDAVRRYGLEAQVGQLASEFSALSRAASSSRMRSVVDERQGSPRQEFTVVSLGPEMALVVPSSEASEKALRALITICTCTKDPSHVWLPHELSTPGRCVLDGSSVNCS